MLLEGVGLPFPKSIKTGMGADTNHLLKPAWHSPALSVLSQPAPSPEHRKLRVSVFIYNQCCRRTLVLFIVTAHLPHQEQPGTCETKPKADGKFTGDLANSWFWWHFDIILNFSHSSACINSPGYVSSRQLYMKIKFFLPPLRRSWFLSVPLNVMSW